MDHIFIPHMIHRGVVDPPCHWWLPPPTSPSPYISLPLNNGRTMEQSHRKVHRVFCILPRGARRRRRSGRLFSCCCDNLGNPLGSCRVPAPPLISSFNFSPAASQPPISCHAPCIVPKVGGGLFGACKNNILKALPASSNPWHLSIYPHDIHEKGDVFDPGKV